MNSITQQEIQEIFENHDHERQRCDLSDRDLTKVSFDNFYDFSYSKFDRSNLSGRNLKRTDFNYSDFRGANLSNASVEDCTFQGADFSGANLQGVDFSKAVLTGVTGDRKYIKSLHINEYMSMAYTFDSLWVSCTKISIDAVASNIDHAPSDYESESISIPYTILEWGKIYGRHPAWNSSHPNMLYEIMTKIDPAVKP